MLANKVRFTVAVRLKTKNRRLTMNYTLTNEWQKLSDILGEDYCDKLADATYNYYYKIHSNANDNCYLAYSTSRTNQGYGSIVPFGTDLFVREDVYLRVADGMAQSYKDVIDVNLRDDGFWELTNKWLYLDPIPETTTSETTTPETTTPETTTPETTTPETTTPETTTPETTTPETTTPETTTPETTEPEGE